jgi:Rps23 Pro-64 3,4-dihydroxylase Tpa1-like proline 4-hydroxylase
MSFISKKIENLENLGKQKNIEYTEAKPFPHIVIDDLFDNSLLNKILEEFPRNIHQIGDNFDNKVEKKLSLNDTNKFSYETNNFINFLNSKKFINFLQNITDVKEKLIPDPYLIGGGLHELKEEGYLNVHADFNLHPTMKLDRRLNILIYLNKDWRSEFGGNLELWDKKMEKCEKKIIPIFNKTVIFSTTYNSFHGNPQKINHPSKKSRKSLAMYYYTNGRPLNEKSLGNHSTIFRKRPNTKDIDGKIEFKKIFGQIYFRKKNKIK